MNPTPTSTSRPEEASESTQSYDGAYNNPQAQEYWNDETDPSQRYTSTEYDDRPASWYTNPEDRQPAPQSPYASGVDAYSSPRRPPAPPGDAKKYNPIHYEFPQQKAVPPDQGQPYSRDAQSAEDDVPETFRSDKVPRPSDDRASSLPKVRSARNDMITRYMSRGFQQRLILRVACTAWGAAFGYFVGKSLLHVVAPVLTVTMALLFFVCSFLRNAYGDWVQALGMAGIMTLSNTRRLRRRYPTYSKLKACFGIGERQRFPPFVDNPWAYRVQDFEDDAEYDPREIVEFNMMLTVIAMAFVGSTIGGNLPLIPTWMGALAGGAGHAFLTTLNST